jgi:NAD(P)-dependent dehydrogenase (short-subunit alcohol dehydrogenase family)
MELYKKVVVVTGGGSGMGLAVAKILGKDNYIIIVGRTQSKLESALQELHADGINAEAFACDISIWILQKNSHLTLQTAER